ncbi:MAG TPA: LytTR family DNA-binding domain-containing protein [Lachnospiraceae bacterium]|nr:LytTR family DNA-binding domain-containing protein [Lachnospiraceae bacterium]
MKVTLEQISAGEEELIIRYREKGTELEAILHFIENQEEKLGGIKEGEDKQVSLLIPGDIDYFESVDGTVFAYLDQGVYRIKENLNEILIKYEESGFIRCSRTMLVNIYKMIQLKSEAGGRILATLHNEEKIMISRKYAVDLRNRLNRGRS